jgi:hypothetical protein
LSWTDDGPETEKLPVPGTEVIAVLVIVERLLCLRAESVQAEIERAKTPNEIAETAWPESARARAKKWELLRFFKKVNIYCLLNRSKIRPPTL